MFDCQNIANLQETVDYLKRKMYGTSSEKSSKDVTGQLDLFNETEATAGESVPEPTAEEAVAGYLRNTFVGLGFDEIEKDIW